jgi:hypothetical protein
MTSLTGVRGLLAGAVIAPAFVAPSAAFAPGGVMLEQDECVRDRSEHALSAISAREKKQVCEDIAKAGRPSCADRGFA